MQLYLDISRITILEIWAILILYYTKLFPKLNYYGIINSIYSGSILYLYVFIQCFRIKIEFVYYTIFIYIIYHICIGSTFNLYVLWIFVDNIIL